MESEHEYTIHIKKEYSNSSNGTDSTPVAPNGETKPNLIDAVNGTAKKSSTSSVGLKVLAVSIGKSYLQYGLSNVGKWTGNSGYQKMINGATEVAGIGLMAKANPYVAVAVVAAKAGTTWMDAKYDNYMSGLKSKRALNRAGYSSIDEVIGVKH